MITDNDIKMQVEQELLWDARINPSHIGVSVNDRVVTLSGFVHAYSHKLHAERDAQCLAGEPGVANNIEVRPQAALKRSALIEASGIKVEADGDAVILSGKVRSWTERDEVERAAWMAPGITAVTNQRQVSN